MQKKYFLPRKTFYLIDRKGGINVYIDHPRIAYNLAPFNDITSWFSIFRIPITASSASEETG